MLKGKDLHRRSVVDVDSAEKLGHVDDLVLDPARGRVAALLISRGPALGSPGPPTVIPASSVQAIGPDALTVRRAEGAGTQEGMLESLPRWSKLTGRKVVSEGGKLLGSIDDVLLADDGSRILGYTLQEHGPAGGLDALLGGVRERHPRRLRAEADLRASEDLVVVPDEALEPGEEPEREAPGEQVSRAESSRRTPAEEPRARREQADRDVAEAQRILRRPTDPGHESPPRTAG